MISSLHASGIIHARDYMMLSGRSADLTELLPDFSTEVAAVTLKNNLSSFPRPTPL